MSTTAYQDFMLDPFAPEALEQSLRAFVESEGVKIGAIINALRVAVSGKGVGFGMFETLALLGRDRCLERIDATLGRLG